MARERILLVDDNAVTLKLARALLELENYEVATAPSAEYALATIAAFRPHLILTDVRLTGMDGLEMTRRLRATAAWRSIPIIAVTGLNAPEDERNALDAGCNAWLTKPVNSQVLRSLVRQHLESSPPAENNSEIVEDLVAALRVEFLSAGAEKCRRLLAMLPLVAPQRNTAPLFDYQELRRALHDWAGGGGTFGVPHITEKAREAEALLKQPLEQSAVPLRTVMEDLLEQFTHPPVEPNAPVRPAQPIAASEAPTRKPVILVCDDDPLVLAVIKSTLEGSGMICRTAGNGSLAVAMARHHRPDAIVLDLNMPTLDGIEVLDQLRGIESTRHLKVMLLTAHCDAEAITLGVCHGADDYMAKPFDPAALVDRLKTLLATPESA